MVVVKEVLARLVQGEVREPSSENLLSDLLDIVGDVLLLVINKGLDAVLNVNPFLLQVLLEVDPLSNHVAFHGLFLQFEELSDLVIIFCALHLAADEVAADPDGVHQLRLE